MTGGGEAWGRPTSAANGAVFAQAAASDSIETNNYRDGGAFSDDGSGYNVSVDPAATIQELVVTDCGAITMDLTLVGGETLTGIELDGRPIVVDSLEVDSVTFKDPDGTTAELAGFWVGEA